MRMKFVRLYALREACYAGATIILARAKHMTPDEFQTALDQLGWKQSDFCRMAGVDKNTPSRWLKGTTPIPGWTPRFLGMALEIRRLATLIEPPKPE